MKTYNVCLKKTKAGQWSQFPTRQETGLRNSRGPYALVNWRPPSPTSSEVLGERGAPRRNRWLSSARPNPPPATETRPRQPLHLLPATRGRLRRFGAERRLPEEGGARSPPSRRGALPRSPTVPSPAVRALRRPLRGRGLARLAAGEGGRAYLSAAGELPRQSV